MMRKARGDGIGVMKGVVLHWRAWATAADGGMPAAAFRLRLFREGRLAVAAAGLTAFPALALAGPWTAAAALMLAGLLPAAIALDCRKPEDCDRAASMGLVASTAVLAAGILTGLPSEFVLAILALQAIEAVAAGARSPRIAAIGLFGLVGIASSFATPHGEPAEGAGLAMALVVIANAMVLVSGLLRAIAADRRAAAEASLQAREVQDVMSESVVAADRSGAVLRVTGNAERLLGLPGEALQGRGLAELVLVADRPALLTALCGCAHGGEARRLRLRLRASLDDSAPRYRTVEFAVAPGGEGVALAVLRDVTAVVAAEECQAALAAEGEAARRARAAFLSTINHELRTPLNAIIGFSDILANPATTPQSPARLREYAALINGAGQDLLRIVNAMIDITRLDSGSYEFEAEPAELCAAVAAATTAFRLDGGIGPAAEVEVVPAEAPVEVRIDERAFRAVLNQILANAVKFGGSAGPITVSVAASESEASVVVRDRGPGVPTEKLAQLGRHFARGDDALSRSRGGPGLGLSLAAGLMALHGGRIGIANAADGGAVVTLTLPRPDREATGDNIHPLPQRRPAEERDAEPAAPLLRRA